MENAPETIAYSRRVVEIGPPRVIVTPILESKILYFPERMIERITVTTSSQGLHEFTSQVERVVRAAGMREGLCTIFIRHTSASLVIQENADPSAKHDLGRWLNRLVPERDALYTHTTEGDDDMPAHIKAALMATSLSIPICDSELALGTWQGVYLWEHRHVGGAREVVIYINL